jgi:alpha-tubulin suppressor-like RCC1 family protein
MHVRGPNDVEDAFTTLALGGSHSCALDSLGKVYCWGKNSSGQVGNGSARRFTLTVSPSPVRLTAMNITVNGERSCAIDMNSRVLCWGANSSGELGIGNTVLQVSPIFVETTQQFIRVTAGVDHTCGLSVAKETYCWGANSFHQIGTNAGTELHPRLLESSPQFEFIDAGSDFTCGLTATGSVYCWGSNAGQVLGLSADIRSQARPVLISSDSVFHTLSAGAHHACGLTRGGRAYCWGSNAFGQLGTGMPDVQSNAPTVVAGNHQFLQISAGSAHSCALDAQWVAWCWGNNVEGALGTTSVNPLQPTPMKVDSGERFLEIIASKSGSFSCARRTDNAVYCWGGNSSGQLGIGRFSETEDSLRVVRTPRRLAPSF